VPEIVQVIVEGSVHALHGGAPLPLPQQQLSLGPAMTMLLPLITTELPMICTELPASSMSDGLPQRGIHRRGTIGLRQRGQMR
jgi:hypothetical protein